MIKLLNHNVEKSKELAWGSNYLLFIINAGANLLLLFLTNKYIITFPVFERSWADRLNPDQLSDFFSEKDRLAFLAYFALVFYLLVKYAIVAFILQLGADLAGFKLSFRELMQVVMTAELVFLFPQVLKVCHFFNASGFTIEDLKTYEPFSIAGLLPAGGPGAWQFPLQTFNAWELVYWFLLADGIRQPSKISFKQSLSIVLYSYVPCLFFWTMLVAFLSFSAVK
jgi:hypothetical protein